MNTSDWRHTFRGKNWQQLCATESCHYICGFCGYRVASERGWASFMPRTTIADGSIQVCPACNTPSIFFDNSYFPHPLPGNPVSHLPLNVKEVYEEARTCAGSGAFTAAALMLRKMLMSIAVEKGAGVGNTFAYYIDYLVTNGHITPGSKDWVDHIRKQGNEATHEIALASEEDADDLIEFSEMLLKTIYEYPHMAALRKAKKANAQTAPP